MNAIFVGIRRFHAGFTVRNQSQGILRIKIEQSPQLIGIRTTRGTREVNEDRFQRCTIRLGKEEAIYVGVFDGHGGSRAADYCAGKLHRNIETQYARLLEDPIARESTSSILPEAIRRAFQQTDEGFLKSHAVDITDGTTASIAVIQSLGGSVGAVDQAEQEQIYTGPTSDVDRYPVGKLTLGHVGDTRIVLCDAVSGKVKQLTMDHSPSLPSERERIERAGGYIEQDAFGDLAVMGRLGTSRSIGAPRLKKLGDIITAEPMIETRILNTLDSFLVLFSDGVSSVMDNQEVVDIVKHCKDPSQAAATIIELAERYGTQDNVTALVFRLPAWQLNAVPPPTKDHTQNLRRYKLKTSMLPSRFGIPGGEFFRLPSDSDLKSEDRNQAPEKGPKPSSMHRKSQELPLDRFLIDLFDVLGKDIGKSSHLFPQEQGMYNNVDDRLSFRNSASRSSIGRLSSAEILKGIKMLKIEFRQVTDDGTHQHFTAESVVKSTFELVGRSVDVEKNGLAPDSPLQFFTKQRTSLSATDLARALQQLNVKLFKQQQ